jgi:uncharacterized protein with WD repeat
LTKLLDSAVFYPPVIYGTLVTNKQNGQTFCCFSLNSQHSGEIKKTKRKTFTNTDQPSGQKDWAVLRSEIDEKFGLRLVGYDVCAHRQLGGRLSVHHHNRRENITIRTFSGLFRK